MAPSFALRVNEKATFKYTATLVDETGAAIGPGGITTLTATLYDQLTGAIINGRNNQNVLNANQFVLTSAASSNLTFDSLVADSPMVNATLETEVHVLLIQWTYGVGLGGNKEIAIRVVNINKVS